MPEKPRRIEQAKLILAEGRDAEMFCVWACKAYDVDGVQVIDFGGVNDLTRRLKAVKLASGFNNVKTLAIARDAESDANGAIHSIRTSLANAALPVPGNPFEFAGSAPRIAYMIFCESKTDSAGQTQLQPGTLEDLCLVTVANDPKFGCVEQYIDCIKRNGENVLRPHKTKLYAFLSGKDKFAGMKIGEAAQAGAWNWDHAALAPYKTIITSM